MAVRKYELLVLLDSARSEEQQLETITKIEETVTKYGGTNEKRDIWGKRRLAYPINRRRDGWYALLHFDADSTSEVLPEVERYCKYTEEVFRHMLTLAIVGKSAGDPSLDREEARQRPYPARGGYERRPRREEFTPAPTAEATEAAPAPAPAPEA